MLAVRADETVRAAAGELSAVSVEGAPDALAARDLATGGAVECSPVEGGFSLSGVRAPALVALEWGDGLTAELDVVARRYATPAEVLSYKRGEYSLEEMYGEDSVDVAYAIARAERTIEAAAGRVLQPVVRMEEIERTHAPQAVPVGEFGRDIDARRALAGEGFEPAGMGRFDVSRMRLGERAVLPFETGLRRIPQEMRDAVRSLASWYLLPRSAAENAVSESTDNGLMRFVLAGVDGPTALPEVNAVIARYGLKHPVVG